MLPKTNPRIREATLQILDNQLRDNDPPETKETYHRLLAEGFSRKKARDLLAAAILIEVYDMLTEMKPFNHERFNNMLNGLPEIPE